MSKKKLSPVDFEGYLNGKPKDVYMQRYFTNKYTGARQCEKTEAWMYHEKKGLEIYSEDLRILITKKQIENFINDHKQATKKWNLRKKK